MAARRKIITFQLPHLALFTPQPYQAVGHRLMIEGIPDVSVLGQAFTVVRDNRIAMCCGVRPQQPGVGTAWSLISQDAGRYDMLYAVRNIRPYLTSLFSEGVYRRVELLTATEFCQGNRFARMLGFVREAVLAKRGFHGEDVTLYART